MKKLYTSILAAAIAVTASAAVAPVLEKADLKVSPVSSESFVKKETKGDFTSFAQKQVVKSVSLKKVFKANAAVDAVEGDYVMEYYWSSNGSGGWESSLVSIVPDEGVSNGYIIDGFCDFMTDAETNPFKVVYDASAKTLTSPAYPHLFDFNNGGTMLDIHAVACTVDADNYLVRDDTLPIVFNLVDELTLELDCAALYWGVKTSTGYMGFGYSQLMSLNYVNGFMEYTQLVVSNGQTTQAPAVDFFRTYAADGKLVVENFGGNGFGFPIEFDLDLVAKTASAADAVVARGILEEGGAPQDIYVSDINTNLEVPDDEVVLNGTIGEEALIEGNPQYLTSTVTIPLWAVVAQDRFSIEPVGLPAINTTMHLLYNLNDALGGVDRIETDTNNENAPVEYFNLQGVKVENPANGLYIKRQGSKVSKVIVK